ncbi:MAG: hypothetical protein ABF709_04915 [Leuconostoc pseudomesenteroides]|uniref:hypothetical protein n=1 Tax=Leuconostoc pseudomesenteroides TaxID=33968 RepID=UPI001E2DD5F6|nr:hypothetical protein [Leuconostoc pseudomesenteroides]MCC7668941.1 hypothetical protein [Leuconostoc pseudomesenteroides]
MSYLTEIQDTLCNNEKLSQWFTTDKKMIFVSRIPQAYLERRDLTTVLISGLANSFIRFGGNQSRAREEEIEIKIWYAPNTSFEDLEWSLNESMESIGFHSFYYDGPKIDEETQQYKGVLQYRRTKFKGE